MCNVLFICCFGVGFDVIVVVFKGCLFIENYVFYWECCFSFGVRDEVDFSDMVMMYVLNVDESLVYSFDDVGLVFDGWCGFGFFGIFYYWIIDCFGEIEDCVFGEDLFEFFKIFGVDRVEIVGFGLFDFFDCE